MVKEDHRLSKNPLEPSKCCFSIGKTAEIIAEMKISAFIRTCRGIGFSELKPFFQSPMPSDRPTAERLLDEYRLVYEQAKETQDDSL